MHSSNQRHARKQKSRWTRDICKVQVKYTPEVKYNLVVQIQTKNAMEAATMQYNSRVYKTSWKLEGAPSNPLPLIKDNVSLLVLQSVLRSKVRWLKIGNFIIVE
jgi:hypothetical protein